MAKMLPSKECRNCKSYFTPKRKSQVFCTGSCRNAYYDEHYFHKVTAMKVCPNCGDEFTTTKPLAQTYCSPKCREEAQLKKAYREPLEYEEEATRSLEEFVSQHPDRKPGSFTLSDGGKVEAKRLARTRVGLHHVPAKYKRPYPEDGICELCGKNSRRINWHHWNDEELSEGLYLCRYCHTFAERTDQGVVTQYLELKEQEISRVKQLKTN